MYYIAVHGGAGFLNRQNEDSVKRALISSCMRGLDSLRNKKSALAAVAEAICVLEDDPCLNAGFGSNLTITGNVECDAAIMDASSGDFGSVGSVTCLKNPIRMAKSLLEYSRSPDPLGRIPPMTLVGEGASIWASSHATDTGMSEIVSPLSLVSPNAKALWSKWKTRLDSAMLTTSHLQAESLADFNAQLDTVGAITLDSNGGMAAGVSSGGVLLKHPGRIGEAAFFGAGCWAEVLPSGITEQCSQVAREPAFGAAHTIHPVTTNDNGSLQNMRTINDPFDRHVHWSGLERGMACSVSGAGEHIVRAMLARTLAQTLGFDSPQTRGILSRTSPIIKSTKCDTAVVRPTYVDANLVAEDLVPHSGAKGSLSDKAQNVCAHAYQLSSDQLHQERDDDGAHTFAASDVEAGGRGGRAGATRGGTAALDGSSQAHIRRVSNAAAQGGRIDGIDCDMDLDAPGDNSANTPSADSDDSEEGEAVDVHEALREVLVDRFWAATRARGESEPSAGVILLTKEGGSADKVRLWCAFTTPTMAIAYATPNLPKPKAIILRRDKSVHLDHGAPSLYITSIAL